jgi:hypothetical protein
MAMSIRPEGRGTVIDVDQNIDSIVGNYVSASRTTEQENR